MNTLPEAVEVVLAAQKKSHKPLAVILAGHNGSGKSTMWYEKGLADKFQIPLINADRMMLSILPEGLGTSWASKIRDSDQSWMRVAQKGVEAFVAQAMAQKVPFAMETVFSHWKKLPGGKIESKIDLVRQMQKAGYFVLLFFVGLSSVQLSIGRVLTRVATGGHDVDNEKLRTRFPRTQEAIKQALDVADAAILADNSGEERDAFTVCRVQVGGRQVYDCRNVPGKSSQVVLQWLDVVSPHQAPIP